METPKSLNLFKQKRYRIYPKTSLISGLLKRLKNYPKTATCNVMLLLVKVILKQYLLNWMIPAGAQLKLSSVASLHPRKKKTSVVADFCIKL